MSRTRTLDENRALFHKRAAEIRDQRHFDACMELFPEEMREQMRSEVAHLLKQPFVVSPPTET